MTALKPPYRQATARDARAMAELINFAGEGLPLYLWSKMGQPGESAWEIGMQRAQREAGSFSFGNTALLEVDGSVAAALVSYALPEQPEAIDYDEMPAMFVPLQELENMASGTWYVNVLAAYPEHRGKGYGAGLLALAEDFAHEAGCRGMSLIVSDTNSGARKLYERSGYALIDSRPMVKEEWENRGENWLLMIKTF